MKRIKGKGFFWLLAGMLFLSACSPQAPSFGNRLVRNLNIPVWGALYNEFHFDDFNSLVSLETSTATMVFVFVPRSNRLYTVDEMLTKMEESDSEKSGPESYRPHWNRLIPKIQGKTSLKVNGQAYPAAKVELPGRPNQNSQGLILDLKMKGHNVTVMAGAYKFDEGMMGDYIAELLKRNP